MFADGFYCSTDCSTTPTTVQNSLEYIQLHINSCKLVHKKNRLCRRATSDTSHMERDNYRWIKTGIVRVYPFIGLVSVLPRDIQ